MRAYLRPNECACDDGNPSTKDDICDAAGTCGHALCYSQLNDVHTKLHRRWMKPNMHL